MKKFIFAFIFLFIISCQPIEKIEPTVFDNKQLNQFDILSNSIEIITIFEKKISDPYIGHTLKVSPSQRIVNWVNDNFDALGNENNFKVNIIDATLTKTQFENNKAKNFDEKNNYKYEIFFLVEFNLFDDSNNLVSSTLVETTRSTTSGLYISIQEKENIINDLIYQALFDLSTESNYLLRKYMSDFIL